MRYRLRTLLIVLALGPPLLWGLYPVLRFVYRDYREGIEAEQAWHRAKGDFMPMLLPLLDRTLPAKLP